MMLVISNKPEVETARLGKQAMPINPTKLDPVDIARLGDQTRTPRRNSRNAFDSIGHSGVTPRWPDLPP